MRNMAKTRVLLANEPRSYRETIASALRHLRPNLEVLVAEPEDLDGDLDLHRPDIVICSEITAAARDRAPAWIELYPGGESLVVVSIEGRRRTFEDIELQGIVCIVDRAGELVRREHCPRTARNAE